MKWLRGIVLALSLGLFACVASAQSPTPTPTPNAHPGTWQIQPGVFVPCNGIKPFLPFTNLGDGQQWYLQGDVTANLPHPQQYGTLIDAIYFNHSKAVYDFNGLIIPLRCQQAPGQLCPANSYPAPADASQVCSQWAAAGNTSACPNGSTPQQYSNAWVGNSVGVWRQSIAFYQPSINAACSGGQPTPTPTPTPRPTATPAPTPVPTPDPFAAWDEQLAAEGITAGCSANPKLFCPGSPLTREQAAVWLLKAEHGASYQPPPCTGVFQDVICAH